nr:uncharacterized protein LOC127338531 [Lolium perenne]
MARHTGIRSVITFRQDLWYFFRFSVSRYHVGRSVNVGNDPYGLRFVKFSIMRLALPGKVCWKKTVPNGNTYRCTGDCPCREEKHRYKLPVSAKENKPNEENKEFIGEFMFFGDHGKILIGHDAELVVATARGKASDLPPAVQNVVGTKCLVTACVTQEAYEADNITSAESDVVIKHNKNYMVSRKSSGTFPT